jgi:hypothetical protein
MFLRKKERVEWLAVLAKVPWSNGPAEAGAQGSACWLWAMSVFRPGSSRTIVSCLPHDQHFMDSSGVAVTPRSIYSTRVEVWRLEGPEQHRLYRNGRTDTAIQGAHIVLGLESSKERHLRHHDSQAKLAGGRSSGTAAW